MDTKVAICCSETIPFLKENVNKALSKVRHIEESLVRLKEDIDAEASRSERLKETGASSEEYYDAITYRALQDTMYLEIFKCSSSLYQLLRVHPQTDLSGRGVNKVEMDEYRLTENNTWGVRLFLGKDQAGQEVILCRVPLLATKPARVLSERKDLLTVYSHDIFCHEISTGMSLLIHADPTIMYRFATKTVSFFFVYNQKKKAMDADNHDTKKITDALTAMLNNGDSAMNCSFYYDVIITNEVPEGTYICVAPGRHNIAMPTILREFRREENRIPTTAEASMGWN